MSVVQATRWAVFGDSSLIRLKLLEMNSETVDRKLLLLEESEGSEFLGQSHVVNCRPRVPGRPPPSPESVFVKSQISYCSVTTPSPHSCTHHCGGSQTACDGPRHPTSWAEVSVSTSKHRHKQLSPICRKREKSLD